MSLLATGLASPDVLQFATEPITIVGTPGIEFEDLSGNVVGTMGYDGTDVTLKVNSGTQFAISQANGNPMLVSFSATGNMTIPNSPNGLVAVSTGIVSNPPVASYDVSPAQMVTFAGVFGKGLWIITGCSNSTRPPAYPGVACNVTITKDPAGTPVIVGQAKSFVGSDTSDSVGNYWLEPFSFMIPMTQVVDTTKTYRVAVTNGYVSTIQYVPLY
jgi:hypothetical protein